MILRRLSMSLMALLLCLPLPSPAAEQRQRVVVLIDALVPAVEVVRRRLEEAIRRNPDHVEFFTEVFDASHFPEPEYEARLVAFLSAKYESKPVDLVLALGPDPLGLMARNRDALFPEAPIVFVGVREATLSRGELPPHATGVTSHFGIARTLELALALQPDARQAVVVSGAAPIDVSWNVLARASLDDFSDRISITYLSELPVAKVLEEVRRLPSTAIVIYTSILRDGAGEGFRPQDLAPRIAASSRAPVYGAYETYLGSGIVGGYMDTFKAMADEGAALARRVLAGENAESLPIQRDRAARFVVDWRQLRRWGLDESRLPAGTDVRFREPSLWDRYRAELTIVIALVVLQAFLIGLLLLRAAKRRVERTLQESESRYNDIVEAESDLICRYLPDTTLTFVNDAFCRYFERRREELIGTRFTDLVPDPERTTWMKHVQSLLDNPRSETHTQQVTKRDGSKRWQQWIERVAVDANGQVAEVQGICRDITELKAAEAESQHRRDQVTHLARVAILGELVGALAHELNQPLTAIRSNAHAGARLLARDPVDLAEIRDILDDIVSDDVRASEVIARLRPLLKRGTLDLQPVDINDVISEVLLLAHSHLMDHRVAVVTRLAPALPQGCGDRVQLQQVMLNLILNACEAMNTNESHDRTLSVSTSCDPRYLVVSVEDNGTGMAPEAAPRVFESFFTTKRDGLGLGLSICRSIISAHGGTLSAHNNPDRGATFTLTLPQ